jgi:hypothetical protein
VRSLGKVNVVPRRFEVAGELVEIVVEVLDGMGPQESPTLASVFPMPQRLGRARLSRSQSVGRVADRLAQEVVLQRNDHTRVEIGRTLGGRHRAGSSRLVLAL